MNKGSIVSAITLRYLFGKGAQRQRSLRRIRGGILGIAFSMIPLVLVYEVASGMVEGISVRFLETWSGHLSLGDAIGRDAEQLLDGARTLEAAGLATLATPEIEGYALVRGPTGSAGAAVRAVEPDRLERDTGMARYLHVQSGSFKLDDPADLVLGEAVAGKIGVAVGDEVQVVTYGGGSWGGIPRISRFTVQGIVSSGYQDLDRLWVFMGLERGDRLLGLGNSRRSLVVKVPDPYELPNPLVYRGPVIHGGQEQQWKDLEDYRSDLSRNMGDEWVLSTWFELQESQFNHYMATRNVIVFILVLMVLIASVNVSSTMLLLFVEKQQDIAILRAVGTSPRQISGIFLGMGLTIGALGATLGIGGGIGLSLMVNELIRGLEWLINQVLSLGQTGGVRILNPEFYLTEIPVKIHWGDQALILLLAMAIALLASWLPARRAAKLPVLDVIRKA